MAEISVEEKRRATAGIIDYMLKNTVGVPPRDAVVFIYNNAIEDAADALGVYAQNNPQHRVGLMEAASELVRNFRLIDGRSS